MDKAFDVVLQSEVDATVIAKNSYRFSGERFRYQCLCCGEEVYLAAADSSERSPHFRHWRGNNDDVLTVTLEKMPRYWGNAMRSSPWSLFT